MYHLYYAIYISDIEKKALFICTFYFLFQILIFNMFMTDLQWSELDLHIFFEILHGICFVNQQRNHSYLLQTMNVYR